MLAKFDQLYAVQTRAKKLIAQRSLLELKLVENENSEPFLEKFEKAINNLKSAGVDVSEEEKVNYLLLALPPSLSHIADTFDAIPQADRNSTYLKRKLKASFESSTETLMQALVTKKFQNPRGKPTDQARRDHQSSRYPRRGSRGQPRYSNSSLRSEEAPCQICERTNHQASTCYHCYEEKQPSSSTQPSRGQTYNRNPRQNTGRWRYSNGRGRGYQSQSNYSQQTNSSPHTEVNSFEIPNNHADILSFENIIFPLDSGCSDHIINDEKYFFDFSILNEPISVTVADGNEVVANKVGRVRFFCDVYG